MNEKPSSSASYIARQYPEQWKKYERQLQDQENINTVVRAIDSNNQRLLDTLWKQFDRQMAAEKEKLQPVPDNDERIDRELDLLYQRNQDNFQEQILEQIKMTNRLLIMLINGHKFQAAADTIQIQKDVANYINHLNTQPIVIEDNKITAEDSDPVDEDTIQWQKERLQTEKELREAEEASGFKS